MCRVCLPNFSRLNMESESGESKRNIEFIPVLFFSYYGYINWFQPFLVHNEENAASQACRWTVWRLSLQVVYYRGRVPPPQQTLRTRLPGDRSWRYNPLWYSGSLRWVRKVQRTYRLVWVSSFSSFFLLSLSHHDRIWTALNRGVHSADFMFQAFKNGHQGKESVHDVYCSACGIMIARSRNNAEGGQPDIFLAGVR